LLLDCRHLGFDARRAELRRRHDFLTALRTRNAGRKARFFFVVRYRSLSRMPHSRCMRPRVVSGFTLLEIAVVLLVLGLLVAGVMKGQELFAAARVRSVIQQHDGVKTAYFGFLDRFKAPPGDYANATASFTGVSTACGVAGNPGNGNGNWRIQTIDGETLLAWEHLAKAGFLTKTYSCAGNAIVNPDTAPRNPYGQYLQLVFDNVYAGAARDAHNLKTGNDIPSDILAEVDRKIDDGNAAAGVFRGSTYTSGSPTDATCWDATSGVWNSTASVSNCGGATLF
jgi:prepilin-type N-terminal cleavage/methylation domain-containing protein